MTNAEYPVQYTVIKNLMGDMDIECDIYVSESNRYDAFADKNGIKFTTAVIEDYIEQPYVLRFFAAHELVHIKYKEYGFLQALKSTWASYSSAFGIKGPLRKGNAQILLSEMRANLEGASYAKLTPIELIMSQDAVQERNNDSVRPKSYNVGYPDREMIKEYAHRYQQLTETVAYDILLEYCTQLKIRNHEQFIKKAISKFFNKPRLWKLWIGGK
ncbi:hypothetical protein [Brevibacillus sp. IT-7CA2]|uniref:hypothetical protein n=1 Tax=Brevibacillus sp. IT-7CA2 TaxID=3026436 RepID=UPI0039E06223